MSTNELAQEIVRQNECQPTHCFRAVAAVAVQSALETDALALAVMTALQQEVARQYHLAVEAGR